MLINKEKRTSHLLDFASPADYRAKIKESKKLDQFMDLKRSDKVLEHEDDSDTNCSWSPWNICQEPEKEIGGIEDQVKN